MSHARRNVAFIALFFLLINTLSPAFFVTPLRWQAEDETSLASIFDEAIPICTPYGIRYEAPGDNEHTPKPECPLCIVAAYSSPVAAYSPIILVLPQHKKALDVFAVERGLSRQNNSPFAARAPPVA
jgi:hypothetical protein